MRSLEFDINPACSTKKSFNIAHEKIKQFWDLLDSGARTANEVVVLCANVYDDSLVGDSPFISCPDEDSASESDGLSTDSEAEDSTELEKSSTTGLKIDL